MQHTLVQRLRDRAYSSKVPDPLVEEAATEIERMRLTDEEREAIEIAIPFLPDGPYTEYDGTPRPDRRATLRSLLDRTK